MLRQIIANAQPTRMTTVLTHPYKPSRVSTPPGLPYGSLESHQEKVEKQKQRCLAQKQTLGDHTFVLSCANGTCFFHSRRTSAPLSLQKKNETQDQHGDVAHVTLIPKYPVVDIRIQIVCFLGGKTSLPHPIRNIHQNHQKRLLKKTQGYTYGSYPSRGTQLFLLIKTTSPGLLWR